MSTRVTGTLISIICSARLALDSTSYEFVNTTGTPKKSLQFCLIVSLCRYSPTLLRFGRVPMTGNI